MIQLAKMHSTIKTIVTYCQIPLIIAVLFLLFRAFNDNDKIAYVNSGRILDEYKGSVAAKKAYQEKAKVWQSNIDTLTSEVKSAIQKHEKSLATMTAKEQDLSKQLIQIKEKQLTDYQRSIQETARQEDGKLTEGIVTQINAFLLDYGKKHNYKLILIANSSGTIAYGEDGLDITEPVITALNNQYEVGRQK